MKWLWAIVLLFVIGAAVVLGSARRGSEATRVPSLPAAAPVAASAAAPAPAPTQATKPRAVGADPSPEPTPSALLAAPAALPLPLAVEPAAVEALPAQARATEAPTPVPATTAPPAEDATKVAAAEKIAAEVVAALASPGVGGVSPEASGPDAAAALPDGFVIEPNPKFPADKLVPVKVERKEGGVLVLDGRFPVRGTGTKADPYRFSWDLLVSAQETYKPRMGQMKLPQRVAMLDGKHVRIAGYVAFPITSANPKEMLSMLNQWDGCCIGVPPTAYDAVEVKLANAANAKQRMAMHGTVEGKLKVDPYLDGGWLLGLYLIDDATLTMDD